jgi:hypothetical protein
MADTNHDHPLNPTRPSVPGHLQPHSTASHPGALPEPEDHTVAHEESDVNVRAIAYFVIGLVVVAAIVHVGLWLLINLYATQSAEADPRVAPLSVPAGTLPPEPRLLTNEPEALQQLRDEEDGLLQTIEAAKQAVLDQGLPARADGTAPELSPAQAGARLDTSSGQK